MQEELLCTSRPQGKVLYQSQYLRVIDGEGIRGKCYLIPSSEKKKVKRIVDNQVEDGGVRKRLTEIEMFLSTRTQMFQVQKRGDPPLSKYTLNEINLAEACKLSANDADFEANRADPSFQHCFKIQCRTNAEKIIACASEADRDQWLRCLILVLKMKRVGIDMGRVSLFTFEKFYTDQLFVACVKFGIEPEPLQLLGRDQGKENNYCPP